MFIDATGWTTIGSVSAAAIAAITIFIQNYFQLQVAKLQSAKIDALQVTAAKTAATVDGHLGTVLEARAISAQALAIADPTQVNQQLAASSAQANVDHVNEQRALAVSEANKPKPDTLP